MIDVDLTALGKTKWWEVGIRFLFGGAITVIAGLLAREFGPAFGGLFLAFPAIFPASATLVEKHEQEKKRQAGIEHSVRGRKAAALDANGAAWGAIALLSFACVVWKLVPRWNTVLVLLVAVVVWLFVAVLAWRGSRTFGH